MSLEVLALVGMATAHTLTLIVASFVLYLTVSPIIYLSLDIFLEKLTTVEGTTGSVRGTFLTAQNITQVVSPLLVSLFLYNNGYSQIYFHCFGSD
jgi:hypothetical protein